LNRPYLVLITVVVAVACGSTLTTPGDHVGSWLLVSNRDVVSPEERTVFTLEPDGEWIIDFAAPGISGTSVGTYEIFRDTLTTWSQSREIILNYVFCVTTDSLHLDQILERFSGGNPDQISYVKVDSRGAAFRLTSP
jgi:hypothetical protein